MAAYAGRGVHGQVVETIARRIISGELGEQATIDITALGHELDVSLTVLREALKVLAAKGLVDARQKRGTFVRPRPDWHLLDADLVRWQVSGREDPAFLDNLTEVRGIIEPAVAALAAHRRTEDDLLALTEALEQMRLVESPAEAVDADLAFHHALLAATHNELLERMDVVLETGLAQRDRLVHGNDPAGGHDPLPSHRDVLNAVFDRDGPAAERAMRALLAQAREDVERLRER